MSRYRAHCEECPDRGFDVQLLEAGAEVDRELHNFFAHEDRPIATVQEVTG